MIYRIDWAVFFNQIQSGTDMYVYVCDCSQSRDTLLPCNCYEAHYALFVTVRLLLLILCYILFCVWIFFWKLTLSIVMKLIKTNNFVVSRAWRSLKLNTYGTINKIPGDFAAIRFWIQFCELHVWPYVHFEK